MSAATDPFDRDIFVLSAVATFSPEIPGIRFKLVGAAPVRIKPVHTRQNRWQMQRARSLFCQHRSLFESGVRILGSGIRLGLRSSNLSRGVGAFLYCGGIYPGLCALTTLSAAAAADPSASVAFAFLALAALSPAFPGIKFGS